MFNDAGISDHAPSVLRIAPGRALPPEQRAINKATVQVPRYKEFLDKLLVDCPIDYLEVPENDRTI